jgi:hypothetical protein
MATETINANAYVLGITKQKMFASFYKLFYNAVINGVTDTHSPARAKWWFPAFPDADVDNSEAYPIGVINSPELDWEKFTLHKKKVNATVDIEIYCTKTVQLDSLSDQIISAVEGQQFTFMGLNVRFLNLEGTDTDHFIRDKITIHNKTLTFTCSWTFTKNW